MYNPISWHIEPTSRCTLACPGCDRTWYNKTFKKQIIEDIDVDALVNFFKQNNFENSKIRPSVSALIFSSVIFLKYTSLGLGCFDINYF